MKKIIFISGIMMLIAANVFAATAANKNTTADATAGFARSKNVDVAYQSTESPAAYFTASAKNSNGNNIYGAISTSSSVYQKPSSAGYTLTTSDIMTAPTAAAPNPATTGWTSM